MDDSLVVGMLGFIAFICLCNLVYVVLNKCEMDSLRMQLANLRSAVYKAELRASTACQLIKELEQRIVSMTGDTHESRQQHPRRRDEDPACQVRSDVP